MKIKARYGGAIAAMAVAAAGLGVAAAGPAAATDTCGTVVINNNGGYCYPSYADGWSTYNVGLDYSWYTGNEGDTESVVSYFGDGFSGQVFDSWGAATNFNDTLGIAVVVSQIRTLQD